MPEQIVYILMTGHDSGYKQPRLVSSDKTKLHVAAHKFFKSYGFEIKDGKPYDSGNEEGGTSGFDCFEDVKMEGDLVVGFVHCGGDGPVCSIISAPSV